MTLLDKTFILLFLKHIRFLIKCTVWKVTKIHSHFIFDQERFKYDYIIRIERLATKDFVQKHFFKQLNNFNFGYDCRDNLENRTFEPIFHEAELKRKYSSISDKSISSFVNSRVVIAWSWLAEMQFCFVVPESWQCYKFFINHILRLQVKSFIPARQDPSFVLPGSRFAGTKFYHVIASTRIREMKKLIKVVITWSRIAGIPAVL